MGSWGRVSASKLVLAAFEPPSYGFRSLPPFGPARDLHLSTWLAPACCVIPSLRKIAFTFVFFPIFQNAISLF